MYQYSEIACIFSKILKDTLLIGMKILLGRINEIKCFFLKRVLSRAEPFGKLRQFWWCHLKIWTAVIITNWIFFKNMTGFMKLLESWHCPYYHKVKFSKKESSFVEMIENLNCPYYHEGKFFAKWRQFCWCDFKIWTARIITS